MTYYGARADRGDRRARQNRRETHLLAFAVASGVLLMVLGAALARWLTEGGGM